MPRVLIKRGTRAQLDAAATAGELHAGEDYLITDEGRLAVGTSATAYAAAAKEGEGGGGGGLYGGIIDGGNANTIYAGVPAFDFGSAT